MRQRQDTLTFEVVRRGCVLGLGLQESLSVPTTPIHSTRGKRVDVSGDIDSCDDTIVEGTEDGEQCASSSKKRGVRIGTRTTALV